MNPSLRHLLPEERQAVCAWAMAERWPGLTKGQQLTCDEFVQMLELPGHHSFALSEGLSPAVGFGQIWLAPDGTVNLVRLLIDPSKRGNGLGRRLCTLLLAEAMHTFDANRVKLRVRRDNQPAIAVYRALKFRELEAESNQQVMAMVYERSRTQ